MRRGGGRGQGERERIARREMNGCQGKCRGGKREKVIDGWRDERRR